MSQVTTVELGEHVALLDGMSGNGLLVLPIERDDVMPLEPDGPSLHTADLLVALTRLGRMGWEPSRAEHGRSGIYPDDLLMESERTCDGRRVAGLYGRPLAGDGLTLDDETTAWSALLEIARSL